MGKVIKFRPATVTVEKKVIDKLVHVNNSFVLLVNQIERDECLNHTQMDILDSCMRNLNGILDDLGYNKDAPMNGDSVDVDGTSEFETVSEPDEIDIKMHNIFKGQGVLKESFKVGVELGIKDSLRDKNIAEVTAKNVAETLVDLLSDGFTLAQIKDVLNKEKK